MVYPADPVTLTSEGHIPPNYLSFLKRDALKGVRLGVLHATYDRPTADPEVIEVFKNALRELKVAGAEILDPADVTGLPDRIRRIRNQAASQQQLFQSVQ